MACRLLNMVLRTRGFSCPSPGIVPCERWHNGHPAGRRDCHALQKEQADMSGSIGYGSLDTVGGAGLRTGKGNRTATLALASAATLALLCLGTHAAQAAPTNYQVFFDFDHADLTPKAVEIVDEAA